MDVGRGLLRLWLIAAIAWIATTPYFVSDELCASVRDDQIHDPLRAKGFEPDPNSYRRVVDCFPSDESVTIAWRTRSRALALVFGVPIAAFVLGYGLLWSFKGFNRGGIERASGDKGKTMVSGFFETKPSSETAMDALIRMTYGSVPPPKTAVLEEAVTLAHRDLLGETVDAGTVHRIATGLNQGPMPYSTHDLAVSVALNVFKNPDHTVRPVLAEIEEIARIQVQNWLLERKVAPLISKTFNDTLLKAYSETASPPPPTAAQTKLVQEDLTAAFAKVGINYMNLHPTIHRTLLREAVLFGRIERTVEMFAELAEQAQREGRNDTARAAILLKLMEKKAELLGL